MLVNNAGGVEEPCFPAADPAKWEHTLDLNLRAVMLATQFVLGPMTERGGGAVINIGSSAGLGTISQDAPEYAAAKAGVVRLTACVARCATPSGCGLTASAQAWSTRQPRGGREAG